MNRKQRRQLQKNGAGIPQKKEPLLQVKAGALGQIMDKAREDAKAKAVSAAKLEIRRQILEQDLEYSIEMDTMVLWTLAKNYGWGKKRLLEFYRNMVQEHVRMRKYYQMDDTYPERVKLKEMGVDIEALNKGFQDALKAAEE